MESGFDQYIVFVEESKLQAPISFLFSSKQKFHDYIKLKFKKKSIRLVILSDVSSGNMKKIATEMLEEASQRKTKNESERRQQLRVEEGYDSDSADEDDPELYAYQNYYTQRQSFRYDELKYPSFGQLYILFDICNFDNDHIVNYYTMEKYLFQMKEYMHNFLVFLAQSYGADTITWRCTLKNTSSKTSSMGTTIGADAMTVGGTVGVAKSNGESNENAISAELMLQYDNVGSTLFFDTMLNQTSWCVKINSIIRDSIVPFDDIKYWQNDEVIKNYLGSNRHFRYEFFKSSPFLTDFVRKRQNGMTSIFHEVVLFDSHRTIFDYYIYLGCKYLTTNQINMSYTSDIATTSMRSTMYKVVFYPTKILSDITLKTCVIEDKSVEQLKDETIKCIKGIRNRQRQWEETYRNSMLYAHKRYRRTIDTNPLNHYEDGQPSNKMTVLDKRKMRQDVKYKDIRNIITRERKMKDNKYTMFVILQKYSTYFNICNVVTDGADMNTEDYKSNIGLQKVTFLKSLLRSFHKEIYMNDVVKDDPGDNITTSNIVTYLDKTHSAFLHHMVNHILNSIDMESTLYEYIADIGRLIPLFVGDVSTLSQYIHFRFIAESKYFNDLETNDQTKISIINNILNTIQYYHKYKQEVERKKDEAIANNHKRNMLIKRMLKCRTDSPSTPSAASPSTPSAASHSTPSAASHSTPLVNTEFDTIKKEGDDNLADDRIQTDQERDDEINNIDDTIEYVFMVNKENGSNYASCDGKYVRDDNYIVNSQGAFVNKQKSRFIGWSNGGWILTGTQWLDEIVAKSEDKTDFYFGGFHASISSYDTIASSQWDNYDVVVHLSKDIIEVRNGIEELTKETRNKYKREPTSAEQAPKCRLIHDDETVVRIPANIIRYIME